MKHMEARRESGDRIPRVAETEATTADTSY
jgi:hypothetical protein